MSEEYEVEEVVRVDGKATQVKIRAGNVTMRFGVENGKVKLLGKGSNAQVLDARNLWVPHNDFLRAIRQAGGILLEKRGTPKGRS